MRSPHEKLQARQKGSNTGCGLSSGITVARRLGVSVHVAFVAVAFSFLLSVDYLLLVVFYFETGRGISFNLCAWFRAFASSTPPNNPHSPSIRSNVFTFMGTTAVSLVLICYHVVRIASFCCLAGCIHMSISMSFAKLTVSIASGLAVSSTTGFSTCCWGYLLFLTRRVTGFFCNGSEKNFATGLKA